MLGVFCIMFISLYVYIPPPLDFEFIKGKDDVLLLCTSKEAPEHQEIINPCWWKSNMSFYFIMADHSRRNMKTIFVKWNKTTNLSSYPAAPSITRCVSLGNTLHRLWLFSHLQKRETAHFPSYKMGSFHIYHAKKENKIQRL